MKTLRNLLCLCLCALMLLSACGGTPEQSGAPGQDGANVIDTDKPSDEGVGIMNIATISKIGSVNPHIYRLAAEADVMGWTQMRLYNYFPSEDGTTFVLTGELAAERPIQMDDEGKVWQIKLHEGMKWANGDDINADDVMYTWKMQLDPKLINSRAATLSQDFITILNAEAYYLQGSEGAEPVDWESVGLKKIDDTTLEVTTVDGHNDIEVMMHLTHPSSVLVYDVYYEQYMNADRTETLYGTDGDKYMSSGPFVLDNWVRDAELTFSKNPNYVYKDKIWIAGMVQRVITDKGTQMQMFDNGELDYIELSAEDFSRFEEDPRVLLAPANSVQYLCINTVNPAQPILANINFRKALHYAIDRETISKLTYETPANFIAPTTHIIDTETGERFRETATGRANVESNYSYDPEKAKTYFEQALQEEGITSVTLTILYSDTETKRIQSEFLQKSWPELFGNDKLTVNLQAMPSTQLTSLRKTWTTNPECYEITWGGWASADLAPWNAMKFWTSSHPSKNEPFFSDEFDAAFDAANYGAERFEPGVRERLTGEMEKILLDEAMTIPVAQGQSAYMKSDRLELVMKNWSNRVGYAWVYSKIAE